MVLTAWTEVWTGSYRSRSSIMGPGGRGKIFVILGGAGDINNSFDKYTQLLPHLSSLALLARDQLRLAKAFFAGICPNSSLEVVYCGSRRSIWADF